MSARIYPDELLKVIFTPERARLIQERLVSCVGERRMQEADATWTFLHFFMWAILEGQPETNIDDCTVCGGPNCACEDENGQMP